MKISALKYGLNRDLRHNFDLFVADSHSLLNRGYYEVVDCDLSNYFGEIPHAELMRSVARRVSDERILGLIKAWLEMPVVEDDGKGGRIRTNRARSERKGTPQGAPISPLLSNLYMRRFILGWKVKGYARRFQSEIVSYADDVCILGRHSASEMLFAVKSLMAQIRLTVNDEKTRCLRCPNEPMKFLGYRIGWNYRRDGSSYIGTRPSKTSIKSICRKVSEQTSKRYGGMDGERMVRRLNRMLSGWSNYYHLGQVSPAYRAIDRHAVKRLRQWSCRKHQMKSGGYVRFSDLRLWRHYGLEHLSPKTKDFPWA